MFMPENGGLLDPRMMGLLGMASALGQAGAPSRVPVSFGQALGQGLQGGMQGYLQGYQLKSADDLRKEQIESLKSKRAREKAQREALQGFYGGGISPQDALTQGAAVGDAGPTVTNEARIGSLLPKTPGTPGGQMQQMGGVPNFGGLLAAGVDSKVVNAMMKDWELKNPNINYQGGIPLDPRRGVPVQGAQTIPQTNQQGFSTLPVIGPDGQIRIQVTPGGAEAFRTQQQIQQGTQADYDLVDVPMPDGSVQKMPRSQAVRLLGPQQGTPPGQQEPWAVGMDPAYAGAINAATAGRPRSEVDAIRAVGMADAKGQPISVTVPGAAGRGPNPAQASAAKAKAEADARAASEREVARPQATLAYQNSIDNLDRFAAEASSILSAPGVGRITGVVGAFPDIPGSKAADSRAKLETLKSQIGFNLLQAMRDASKTGGALGNVTEKELAYLQNNLAALQTSQSEDQFKKSLRQIIDYTQKAKERITKAYQSTYSTGQPMRRREDVLKAADEILGL